MRKWTTPTQLCKLSTAADLEGCTVYVTLSQGAVEITKTVELTATTGGYTFEVTLAQEESGRFSAAYPIEVQANVVDSNGFRCASDIKEAAIGRNILQRKAVYSG